MTDEIKKVQALAERYKELRREEETADHLFALTMAASIEATKAKQAKTPAEQDAQLLRADGAMAKLMKTITEPDDEAATFAEIAKATSMVRENFASSKLVTAPIANPNGYRVPTTGREMMIDLTVYSDDPAYKDWIGSMMENDHKLQQMSIEAEAFMVDLAGADDPLAAFQSFQAALEERRKSLIAPPAAPPAMPPS